MPVVTKTLGEGTQSVHLTIAVLEHLASREGSASLSDLAREIGTSKSRVHRHLQTLVACDYATQDGPTGQYSVGPRLVALCRTVSTTFDLARLAEPAMRSLRDTLGHSVIVSRVDENGVHVLQSLSGNSQIVLEVRPGTLLPLDRSAQGKVALAFLDRLDVSGSDSVELATIRAQGWASAEMRAGLKGVAAPILDRHRTIVGTLAILDTADSIGRDVKRSARICVEAPEPLT
jgi:DNA-binding IclR family transcriptional regulator